MNQPPNNFSEIGFIDLKDESWLKRQRIAGKVAADALTLLKNEVANKTTKSLIELNEMAERFILDHNGCIPTFKGYKGFPAGCCMSVNDQLVHGIPSERKLKEHDLISFDLGVTFESAIADTALTVIYGQPKSSQHTELISICEGALYEAIKSIKIGKQLGCIGFAINKYITSKSNFKVITAYGGHGISTDSDGNGIPHSQPFVANKAKQNEGIRLMPGIVLAIEPMCAIGDAKTKVGADGWTVTTNNYNVHQEHSIFIHSDSVEIITYREDEMNKCSRQIFF